MVDTNRATLLSLLLTGYDDLKRRLTRRLGSADLASEALQDTYIRLNTTGDVGLIRSPKSYLFRVALSAAANRRLTEKRRLVDLDGEKFLDFIDDAPDPEQIVEARSEIEALKRAMKELSTRRRAILMAACIDEVPHRKIADRFDVTVRTVQLELKEALAHCARRMNRNVAKRASPRPHRDPAEKAKSSGLYIVRRDEP